MTTPPDLADASIAATWPLMQLVPYVDAHGAALGAEAVASLYAEWLRHHQGREALLGRFNLASHLHRMGRLDEAEVHYRQVLGGMDLPQARQNLAQILELTGRAARTASQVGAVVDPATAHEAGAAALARAPERDPVVYVFAVCFNEAAILPFFLDHYAHHVGARKIVLHDGGSTDGSDSIAARYPQVEFIVAPSEKLDDSALMRLRNEAWKPYRNECDWVVVCDVDEFLFHPDVRGTLRALRQQGVTLPLVEGFNIVSKAAPVYRPGRYLWQDRQAGIPDPRYLNKNLVFDPAIDINYTLGCHHCQPTGPVQRSDGFVFKSLHMCQLSYEHLTAKARLSLARLSDWNLQTQAGFHYHINAALTRAQYNAKHLQATNVVNPRPKPTLRRQAYDELLRHLLGLNTDPVVVELGAATGFGRSTDSGSTELLAWAVYNWGGRLHCLDTDPTRVRHARHELALRQLLGESTVVDVLAPVTLAALPAAGVDLVFLNDGDWLGDACDRVALQRRALDDFRLLEPALSPQALLAMDKPVGAKFDLLLGALLAQGWQGREAADLHVLSRNA